MFGYKFYPNQKKNFTIPDGVVGDILQVWWWLAVKTGRGSPVD